MGVKSEVKSYQRHKRWFLTPPWLAFSIISYWSWVKWSNPGKGVAHSPTPRCCCYWKKRLWGYPRLRSPTLLYIILYYIILNYIILHHIKSILHYHKIIILYHIILYYIIFQCILLYYMVSYCTILKAWYFKSTILYYIILYYIILKACYYDIS